MQFRRGNVSISPMCPGSALGAGIGASPWRGLATLGLAAASIACQVDDRPLSPPTTAGDDGTNNGGTSNGGSGGGATSNGGSGGTGSGGTGSTGSGGTSNGGTSNGGTSNGGTSQVDSETSVGATTPTTGSSGGGASTNATATGSNVSTATNGGTSTTCNAHGEMVIVDTGVPFAQVAYTYGDKVTTICIESPEPGTVCAYGLGAKSDNGTSQFANWGAGVGFRLAIEDANGDLIEPFDASARGIVGLRYKIDFLETGLSVRLGVTRVNTAEYEFMDVPFGPTGDGSIGNEADVTDDANVSASFEVMSLPSWADLDGDPDTVDADLFPFDASELHSVQLGVITQPDSSAPYDFCVSDFEWFDANGDVVSE